jgi:hypothetical protein
MLTTLLTALVLCLPPSDTVLLDEDPLIIEMPTGEYLQRGEESYDGPGIPCLAEGGLC